MILGLCHRVLFAVILLAGSCQLTLAQTVQLDQDGFPIGPGSSGGQINQGGSVAGTGTAPVVPDQTVDWATIRSNALNDIERKLKATHPDFQTAREHLQSNSPLTTATPAVTRLKTIADVLTRVNNGTAIPEDVDRLVADFEHVLDAIQELNPEKLIPVLLAELVTRGVQLDISRVKPSAKVPAVLRYFFQALGLDNVMAVNQQGVAPQAAQVPQAAQQARNQRALSDAMNKRGLIQKYNKMKTTN